MVKGWTKTYREQFNSWISKKPFCDGYAWTYLYSRANHKKGMVNFRNEYIEVERGQLLTSKKQLRKIFGWTRRHLDNFLLALEKDQNLTYRVTHRYIVITITNYNKTTYSTITIGWNVYRSSIGRITSHSKYTYFFTRSSAAGCSGYVHQKTSNCPSEKYFIGTH